MHGLEAIWKYLGDGQRAVVGAAVGDEDDVVGHVDAVAVDRREHDVAGETQRRRHVGRSSRHPRRQRVGHVLERLERVQLKQRRNDNTHCTKISV